MKIVLMAQSNSEDLVAGTAGVGSFEGGLDQTQQENSEQLDDQPGPSGTTGRGFLRGLFEAVDSRSSELNSLQSVLAIIAEGAVGSLLVGSRRRISEDLESSSASSSGSSSDVETFFWKNRKEKMEKSVAKPTDAQLKTLRQNDFCEIVRCSQGPNVKGSVPALIAKREIGCCRGSRGLTSGQKFQILDRYFPNEKTVVAQYRHKVFCGNHSDDGDIFFSSCQDNQIRVYDTSKGGFRLKNSIRARRVGWSVLDTVLSPDKHHLIYSSWCDSIHQVNLMGDSSTNSHEALPLQVANDAQFCIFSLRFSQDGLEILCGSNDGCLYLYDRMSNSQSMKIAAHDDDVNSVAFVDTPTHIVASGGDDGLCKVWDRRALRESNPVPVGVFAGHLDGLTYIDPKGDGRYLLTNSKDQSIKLWDLRKFSSQSAIDETRNIVVSQDWDYRWHNVPRRLHLASREIKDDASVMTYRGGHSILQTLIRCHFSPTHTTGQKFIYTGCASGAVVVYDALTGEVVHELKGHRSVVRDVSWHPFLPEIVSSSWDYKIAKWFYSEKLEDSEPRKVSSKSKAGKVSECAGHQRKLPRRM